MESPSNGELITGQTVTLTLDMSTTVIVNTTGGTPTLSLNDGGIATYTGGSGTNALIFSYTIGAGQAASALAAAAVSLNGATIVDGAGNVANLSLTGQTQAGPQINAMTPSVSSVTASGSGITNGSGDLGVGSAVTLTLNMSQVVVVNTTGGTPTLTLNDGGTAIYSGGSGTEAVTFSYTVAAGQNTAALGVTAVNLNGATTTRAVTITASSGGSLTDANGNVWSFSTTAASGGYVILCNGTQFAGGAGVTLSLDVNGVIWAESNGNAWYKDSGTGWVAESTGPTTGLGPTANLVGAVTTIAGPLQISTSGVTPVISAISESPSTGDLDAGKTVTYTLTMSEVVTVNTTGGSPTLSPQRWRNLHLCQRLRKQYADFQLHGARGSEHSRSDGDGGQPRRRHHSGWIW